MRYHFDHKKVQRPSHVNPVGTPLLFETTYSVSAGPKCVTRLAWQHCSHWIFTWQQPIRTNNQRAVVWSMNKPVIHMGSTCSKTTVGQRSEISKKFITNDFKPLFGKSWSKISKQQVYRAMQLLCKWWYIMNAQRGLWCIHTCIMQSSTQ